MKKKINHFFKKAMQIKTNIHYKKLFFLSLFLLFFHNNTVWSTEQQQKKTKKNLIKLHVNEKKKNWKKLDEEILKNEKKLKDKSKKIQTISTLALLELYKENYKKSYEYFELLAKLEPKSLHFFYKNMALSIVNKSKAKVDWDNYFNSVYITKEAEIWRKLAKKIKKILQKGDLENKEYFRKMIFWFFQNKAYYTSFMTIKIFDKYLHKGKNHNTNPSDEEFIHNIKTNILMKLGYIWDAIAYLKKLEKKQKRLTANQKKNLGIGYYHLEQYEDAIKNLVEIKKNQIKTSTYYYYLSLSYLNNGNIQKYKETAFLLKQKQDKKSIFFLKKLKKKFPI